MAVELHHGDCLEIMKNIPDKSVDLILADLPYGITHAKWDSVIPLKLLWKQYKRIIKDHGAVALFGSEPFSSNLRMSNLKAYRYDWIWVKNKPLQFLNAHRMPLPISENISVFYKHLPIYNPQMRIGNLHNISHGRSNRNIQKTIFHTKDVKYKKDKITNKYYPIRLINFKNCDYHKQHYHPTQKPTDLLRYLVRTYTNENMNVLDNVMGSGSTGVACKQLNRNFIGIEKDTHYFNVANLRINKTKAGEAL